MTKEEYERRRAAGWDDTKALGDYWYGKVLAVLAFTFLAVMGTLGFIAIARSTP